MAKSAQRARIEQVAGEILVAMEAGLSGKSAGEGNRVWRGVDVSLADWELAQAYTLAADAFARGVQSGRDTPLTWTDPRKTGRPRTYDSPLQPVALELPAALIAEIEAARGDTTRREWIEEAIRLQLERKGKTL